MVGFPLSEICDDDGSYDLRITDASTQLSGHNNRNSNDENKNLAGIRSMTVSDIALRKSVTVQLNCKLFNVVMSLC